MPGVPEHTPDTPLCPRCGYDLSGVMTAWDDACPLRGTCSECGLGFHWADVIDARRLIVPGFVEHETGGFRRLFRSAWTTLAWIAFPPRFWSRVHVEHSIVPRRWIIGTLCVLVPLHAVASLASNARFLFNPALLGRRAGAPTFTGQTSWIISGWTYPFATIDGWTTLPSVSSQIDSFPLVVWMTLACHLMFWGLMLLLSSSRTLSGVRALHVHRAGIYGLAWIAALALFRACRNLWLASESAFALQPFGPSRILRIADLRLDFTATLLLTWTCLWWLCAIRQGWRIAAWPAVWTMLTISALLSAAIIYKWLPEIQSGFWIYLVPWGPSSP